MLDQLSKLAEKLNNLIEQKSKLFSKNNYIDASTSAVFSNIIASLESLEDQLQRTQNKISTLSEKKAIKQIENFIDDIDDCSDDSDEEFGRLSKLETTTLLFKSNLNNFHNDFSIQAVDDVINRIHQCRHKISELINVTKHTLSDSSSDSDDLELKSSQSKKRKFEELSISNKPDTLFASTNKRQKVDEKLSDTNTIMSLHCYK